MINVFKFKFRFSDEKIASEVESDGCKKNSFGNTNND